MKNKTHIEGDIGVNLPQGRPKTIERNISGNMWTQWDLQRILKTEGSRGKMLVRPKVSI